MNTETQKAPVPVVEIARRASVWPRIIELLIAQIYPLAALGGVVLIVRAIGANAWLWLALPFALLVVAFNRPKSTQ
jgi:hypothetical protein